MELLEGRDLLLGKAFRHRSGVTTLLPAAAICLPSLAHALGLGAVAGTPILGEPLQLEVPLTGTIDRPLDVECVTIRRSPDAIDADYFPRDLVARIDRQSGAPRLILLGRTALRQPLVEFRLAISCGYNIAHDYVLMASPRSERPQPAAAPQTPVVVPVGPTAMPDGLPGNDVTLERELTLEQLAQRYFSGPLRQGRFMRWVAEANPQLFAGTANLREHRLAAGTQLLVPVGVPPRRPGDYRHGVTPLGEPLAATPSAPPTTAAAGTTAKPAKAAAKAAAEAPSAPPAKAAAAGQKDRLVVGSGGGASPDVKETMVLVERLAGMMQQQVSAQSASHEKIQQLESTIAELGKTIVRMEAESQRREAALQAELKTLRSERDGEDTRGWWQLAVAVLGGGLLGIVLLWMYRLFTERRRGGDDFLADQAREEVPAGSEASARPVEPASAMEPRLAGPTAPPPPRSPPTPRPVAGASAETGRTSATAQPVPPAAPSPIRFEPPAAGKPPPVLAEPVGAEHGDPAKAAIELANIMASMGLADSAAQALAAHIRDNPRQSLPHWIKLLELHRASGNRAEFDRSANEMRQRFNVQVDEWGHEGGSGGRDSIEAYPHIRSQLVKLWRQPECPGFIESLLTDNREGTRAGFPLAVAEELLLLVAVANSESE